MQLNPPQNFASGGAARRGGAGRRCLGSGDASHLGPIPNLRSHFRKSGLRSRRRWSAPCRPPCADVVTGK